VIFVDWYDAQGTLYEVEQEMKRLLGWGYYVRVPQINQDGPSRYRVYLTSREQRKLLA